MSKEVNADLYNFLNENETGLTTENNGKDIIAYVHIYFWKLDDFVKIVGSYPFDEGGREVVMFEDTICVELNDIIEGDGHNLSSYKRCFNENDWENFEIQILEMEK